MIGYFNTLETHTHSDSFWWPLYDFIQVPLVFIYVFQGLPEKTNPSKEKKNNGQKEEELCTMVKSVVEF